MDTQEQLAGRFTTDAVMVVKDSSQSEVQFIEVTPYDVTYTISEKVRLLNRGNTLQSTINKIIDNLTDEYWFNSDTSKETVLEELCEILGHTPVVTWVVSVTVDNNTYDVEVQAEDEDTAIDAVRDSTEITIDQVRYTVEFEGESVEVREDGWNCDIDSDQFMQGIEFSATRKFE
jgi:hypothetical protein